MVKQIYTGSNPVRFNMVRRKLTNLEMIYIIYCKVTSTYLVDPLCFLIAVLCIGDNPLESPFLLGFGYFFIYILVRIPMMFYYHDV